MIRLFTFGPYFGLPDGSPFVIKAMILLKMASLEFVEDRNGYRKAPKGKLPYIDDCGAIVADSTFIRLHIETKYGFDFDAGLSREQRATGVAFAQMADEHLYYALVWTRWMDEANFRNGAARFFESIPTPARQIVRPIMRRRVARMLRAQGIGRHTPEEIAALGARDIDAIAAYLGDKPFLMGAAPTAADASVYAQIVAILTPEPPSGLKQAAARHANLVAYCERMRARYFAV